jgi:DNA-binding transcriptional ArsR family regulator
MTAGIRLQETAAARPRATGGTTMPKKWNFLSNYGLVLTHLFQNPRATLREIARGTDLTERAVYQIVRDLEEGGFIEKKRVGRRNIYTINEPALFNYPIYGSLNVAQMSTALRRILEERRTEAPA